MRDVFDIFMGSVSLAGYDIPVVVLVFVASLVIAATTRSASWGILGTFLLFFFQLFVPAFNYI